MPNLTPKQAGVPDDLDAGESEAIALAIELKAGLILMDERKGTDVARALGLATVGVVGVLLEAKRAGHLEAVMPLIDQLVTDLGFFVSRPLRERIARLAEEA